LLKNPLLNPLKKTQTKPVAQKPAPQPAQAKPAVEEPANVCQTAVNTVSQVNVNIPAQEKACKVEVKEGPKPPKMATIVKKYEKTIVDWGPYKQKSPEYLLAMMKNLIHNYPAPKQSIINAPANCCYGMLVKPPVYKEVVIEYVKHDPKYNIQVTEPKFEKTYKTIKVLVKPGYYKKECENAKYEPKQEKVLLAPGSFKLVERNGIICKVKTPPVEKTITRYVMVQPPKCKTVYYPPVYTTIKVPVYKLVKNASCNCQPGKPELATVSYKYMVRGPEVIWDAVLCDINLRPDEIKAIQAKLKELGYYNGPINGVLDEKTMAAVVKFQVDHNLPAGNVSIQTLEALGLNNLAKNYTACELQK
jgi:hypothetical protein